MILKIVTLMPYCISFILYVMIIVAIAFFIKRKKSIINFLISLLIILISLSFLIPNRYAVKSVNILIKDRGQALNYIQKAVKTSIYPSQRAYYYLHLGHLCFHIADNEKMLFAYKNAYKLIKNYTNPIEEWRAAVANAAFLGEYDYAFNIAQERPELYSKFFAEYYIMNKDYPKALNYLLKFYEEYKLDPDTLASLAFVYKELGEQVKGEFFYYNALNSLKSYTNNEYKEQKQAEINEIYEDYSAFRNKKLQKFRQKYALTN